MRKDVWMRRMKTSETLADGKALMHRGLVIDVSNSSP